MQLIKPSQISGEIMTLIDEADKKIVLVSPYFRVSKWFKLLNKLEAAKEKGLEIELYVREGEIESMEEALDVGIEPITIPNLHTKLYLNEREAIVSSMNLLLSSDTNSLDIALKIENQTEYNQICEYYARYIQNAPSRNNQSFKGYTNWREELDNQLLERLGREAYINEYENKLLIQTSNKYEAFISNERTNDLRIFGILSGKEFDYAKSHQWPLQNSKLDIEFLEGRKGHYDTVWGTVKGLRSWYINDIKKDDQKLVVNSIADFIVAVENLKKKLRH